MLSFQIFYIYIYVKTLKFKINLCFPTGLLEEKSTLLEDTRMGYAQAQIFSMNLKLFSKTVEKPLVLGCISEISGKCSVWSKSENHISLKIKFQHDLRNYNNCTEQRFKSNIL
jgi:hypothetical protein